MPTSTPSPPLSTRAKENSLAGDKWAPLVEALSNVYSDDNPSGAVLMGIAQTSLMHDELAAHIKDNFTIEPDMHFTYGHGPQGSPKLRQALVNLFNDRFHARRPTQAHEFIVTSGVSSALDAATWGICNEGEGVLVPRPLYTGFTNDIPTRSRGKVLPVSFVREDGILQWEDVFDPEANVRALERAKAKAEEEGTKVKAVLITKSVKRMETIKAITSFCAKHNLHYISDEIYALTIFTNPAYPDAPGFHSILSIDLDLAVREDMVHVMYGASKDFGANGLRLGVFHTRNEALRLAMQSIIAFGWQNYLTQDIWARVLSDEAWLDAFVATSQQRLAGHYKLLTDALDARGVPYLNGGNAAMFLWVDLASFVQPEVSEASKRRELEDSIAAACKAQGVIVSKAASYQAEIDGWFRVTFTLSPKLLQVGLDRLFAALDELKSRQAVRPF